MPRLAVARADFVMVTRRQFVGALGVAAAGLQARELSGSAGRVSEWSFSSSKAYGNPFEDVEVDVIVSGPGGEQRVPAFWAGDQTWKVRYSPELPGRYSFRTESSDRSNAGLHGVTGTLEAESYRGSNELYRRGAPRVSASKRYLEHADGTPVFWLGDTWWMGLLERLRWPEDFRELAADRAAKGFNVIQIVAGLYPDMAPLDPRGANEGGLCWEKDFARVNPRFFDMADLRIQHLVDVGLMPCILGCWGYYLAVMGPEKMRRHWRYLISRWGAYPVVWCLAGEGGMPWYLSERKDAERAELERGWTEMARYVRRTDPFHRLITVHPSRAGRDVVTDPGVLDFDMLQTGHGDYASIPRTVTEVTKARDRQPLMPYINSEVCYEGILGRSRHDIQRFMFWASVLNGTCGHTYGANGIWQVNLPGKPFGPSPHGRNWGNTPWREAAAYRGGGQLGLAARLLRRLPWEEMEPHPEWVTPHWNEDNYELPYAAGIPRRLRVVYVPTMWTPPKLTALEPGASYRVTLFNPGNGEERALGTIHGNESGEHQLDIFPFQRDWVLVLEAS